MGIVKKILWVILYLAAFILFIHSFNYNAEKNLISASIYLFIALLIYTVIIFKNIKILSIFSFFTMLLMSLLMFFILGLGARDSTAFFSVFDEKNFMLTLPLIIFFLLVNSILWIQTKKGFLKIIPIFFILLSVYLLIVFGTSPSEYHQNFIYTRVSLLMLFAFSIFLIIKKKKFLGILGIFLSIGLLILSSLVFAGKVYTLEGKEQQEVIASIDPVVKGMFDYYNKEDYANFCKYCRPDLKDMLVKNPMNDKRAAWGPYIYFGDPSKVIYKRGRYYVEYPVKFQNVESLMYLSFVIEENISSDHSIYGFAFSDKPEK